MTNARAGATASPLPDGRVLIAGGESSGVATPTLETFDPVAGTFVPVWGLLATPRKDHAAAVLPDGRVLIAGRSDGSVALDTADIYDPATGEVHPAGKLAARRAGLTATTLLDGRVLLAGGNNGEADLASTEIFVPASGRFIAAAVMDAPRRDHLAIRLPDNNQVLMVGGTSGGRPLADSALYVPWRDVFEPAGALLLPRTAATAGAVKGTVLLAGGRAAAGTTTGTREVLSNPTIQTDKKDYGPGQTVVVTGTYWAPDVTVNVKVNVVTVLPDGNLVYGDLRWEKNLAVDGTGNVSSAQLPPADQLVMTSSDVGKTFAVTATGSPSNRQAQVWTFTDANVKVRASTGVTFTLTWSKHSTNTCTDTASASGTQSVTDSPSYTIPEGASSTEYFKLVAASSATSPSGYAFVKWDRDSPAASFGTATICVQGPSTGSHEYTATYASDTTPPVTTASAKNADNTTHTSGTWTNQNVTLTLTASDTGGSGVKEIRYRLNGGLWTAASGSSVTLPAFTTEGTVSVDYYAVDNAGNTETSKIFTIKIDKTAPTATATPAPAPSAAGWNKTDVTVNFSGADNGGSGIASCSAPVTVTGETAGAVVSGTCTDVAGNTSAPASVTVKIDRTPPNPPTAVVSPTPDVAGWNNSTPVTVTSTSNGDAGPVQSGVATCTSPSVLTSETPVAGIPVAGACTDMAGNSSLRTSVTVKIDTTAPPAPTEVLAGPVPVNTDGTVTAKVTDVLSGIAGAEHNLNGGAYTAMSGSGSGQVTVTGTIPPIATPGVYVICVRARDVAGNTGADTCALLAVRDPSGGFVTGGGWITSPFGAYTAEPTLTGKANFGFVSTYQKGATVPTGQTEFQFKVANLNFHSSTYDWLVVAGARAQYKGSGTINGSGDFGFLLTAIDGALNGGGGIDRFRIKIQDKTSGTVIYDNQLGASDTGSDATALGGGSIVIHSK